MNKPVNFFLYTLLFFILAASSCSTKKNRLVNRSYHNLTAHYNGYFNADLKVKEGSIQLSKAHEDKYDRILTVFRYADNQKAKSVYPLMDEAIKKSSIVIEKHSMLIKGVEYCKWIDNNYLVIGQAQFYKHDFTTALQTFQYMAGQYNKEPVRFDALMWAARCQLMMKNLDDAQELLTFLENDKKFPVRLKGEFSATYAEYYIQKREYEKAIDHLLKAVAFTKKRSVRVRYIYILAQLYEKEGNLREASHRYEQVIKMNPPYEMAFNAKISRARAFDAEGQDSKDVKKQLNKMIRDEKNKEYLDQIYYALGILSLKENNVNGAIEYFILSARSSVANTNQKALSFLELAKIYFGRPDYPSAQSYYDSTAAFLSKDHPEYEHVINRKNSLTKLVKYINIIAFEDSVQQLAKMSEKDLNAYIDDLVAKEQAEAERKKREEEEAKLQQQNINLNTANNTSGLPAATGTGWYFYNTSAISFGHSEFLKKWGTRSLEDNWRRSKKDSEFRPDEMTEEEDTSLATANTASSGPIDRNKFLKNIPLTDKQKETSNNRIIEAYYQLGFIYKEQLEDLPEAIRNFETLNKRFPGNKYALPAYYQLYRIFLTLDKKEESKYYRNLILSKYPDSEYAMLLSNPDYFKEMKAKASKLENFYEQTYRAFLDKNYQEVLNRKSQSDSLFPNNKLALKFDYLKAVSAGILQGPDVLEASLADIVKRYPSDPVKDKAQETLNLLKAKKENTAATTDTTVKKIPYTANPDTVHFYAITFSNATIDGGKLKVKLADYNKKYYSTTTLTVTAFFLDPATQIIVIKEFKDKTAATDFFNGIEKNPEVFGGLPSSGYNQFSISASNFITLVAQRDVAEYLVFFKANY